MESTFENRNIFVYFILFWIAYAAIQFVLLLTAFDLEYLQALTDSLVSMMVFAALGIGLWYMVKYSGKQVKGLWQSAAYHISVGIIAIALWQVICYWILTSIFSTDKAYLAFLNSSIIIRSLNGILVFFLLVSIDYLLLNFHEMKERTLHEAELSAMLRDAELNMLRSQIRPHFLFNSLNSVSALTLTDPAAAQNMIIKLSEFMRHSLNLGADAMSTLSDELYHVSLYLEIEKVRFADRMTVIKQFDAQCDSILIPSMILQPIVENAVKHGVNTLVDGCTITITAACNEQNLELTITNNFDQDALPRKGTGTGLRNVQQRLARIYGRNDLFAVNSENNVFKVKITTPRTGPEN